MSTIKLSFKIFLSVGCIWTYAHSEKSSSHEHVFTEIYTNGVWGRNDRGEGFSGGGSLLQNTKKYIAFLEQFMRKHSIQTVVDAGCGDWEFSRYVDWRGVQYLGFDVVDHVIKKNRERFNAKNVNFVSGNFLAMDLPSADLLICKHVLQHLPNADILSFLPQLKKFKYCLITNEVDPQSLSSDDADISIGGGHKIDLSRPPFNIRGQKVLTYYIGGAAHQVFLIENSAK